MLSWSRGSALFGAVKDSRKNFATFFELMSGSTGLSGLAEMYFGEASPGTMAV